jgi:lysophospholipase L1-like esterase
MKKRILTLALASFATYLVAEAILSAYAWFSWYDTSFWVFEDIGRTWQFDPIRGYRSTRTPSRWMRVTNGVVEYVGVARGNSQGFPDRDDFGPKRDSPSIRRVAVFGDSFTAAQFLGQNWPDRVEDLMAERGEPMQLLNFAVDGGGLANWWSILTRLVDAEDYEIDGVLFAVWGDNLERGFSVKDRPPFGGYSFGRVPTWDPATYPKTPDEAQQYMWKWSNAYNLSPEEFEQTLQGRWPSPAPSRFRLVCASAALKLGKKAYRKLSSAPSAPSAPSAYSDPHRKKLIEDIREYLDRRRIPALVVFIQEPAFLDQRQLEDVKAFAAHLGAPFVDYSKTYENLSRAEIRALHFPSDCHWNQAGSNRFAEFILPHLSRFKCNAADPGTPLPSVPAP